MCTATLAPRGSESGRCLSVADYVTVRGPADQVPAAAPPVASGPLT